MRAPSWLLLLPVACFPRGSGDGLPDPDLPLPPGIVEITLACDAEVGAWTVDVATDAWAGGAVLVWTRDGAYVERHDGFRSVRAAVDGSSDLLRADVAVVSDFRPAQNGRTAFPCRAQPSALLWVLDLDGEVSDCRQLGPAPETLLALDGVPACPQHVDPAHGTDTDETDLDTDETDDTDPPEDTDETGHTDDTEP